MRSHKSFETQSNDDEEWLDEPWKIPALQIWAKMYHKYEGMTDMLTVTMMEELVIIITCVTGDSRHRRTLYEGDQDFERFIKTLITVLTLENTDEAIKHAQNYMQRQRQPKLTTTKKGA